MSSRQNASSRGYGRGAQDVGPGGQGFGRVGFSDVERSASGARRGTMGSSASPGPSPGGKAPGILKQRTGQQDDDGYLKSIKEDN